MDDVLTPSTDIDPITFLQVEMDSHQELELTLGPGVVLPPSSTNLKRIQKTPADDNNQCDINAEIVFNVSGEKLAESMSQISYLPSQLEVRRHVCNVCNYRFKRMDHLKRHMLTHTIDEVLEAQGREQSSSSVEKLSEFISSLNYGMGLIDDVRRYTCNVCHYKFKRADHLKRHMTRTHPEELALIAATEELAKARKAAKQAKESKGTEKTEILVETESRTAKENAERKFACNLCDFKFKRKDHLNRHMTVHTDQIILQNEAENINQFEGEKTEEENLWLSSRRFVCQVCDAQFKRPDHLKRHMVKHGNLTQVSLTSNLGDGSSAMDHHVNDEPIETPTFGLLDDELERTVNAVNVVNGDNNLIEVKSAQDEEEEEEEERRFICTICQFRFKRRSHLKRHIRLIHDVRGKDHAHSTNSKKKNDIKKTEKVGQSLDSENLKCNVCNAQFKLPCRLKRHMARHSEDKLFACQFCDYKGKLAGALKHHIILVHSADKPFACDRCDFKTKVPSYLRKHMVAHQQEAPYQCTLCDFKAKRPGNLKDHMGTHTNEKRFTCNICNFGTRRRRELRNHMATHFDDKPYVCQLCPYRAKLPHYLKEHMKTHTDFKPYVCSLCDYKARQSRLLRRHVLVAHEDIDDINAMEIDDVAEDKMDNALEIDEVEDDEVDED